MHAVKSLLYGALIAGGLLAACKPPTDKVSNDSAFMLQLGADTLLFDTLFTTIGSTTAVFKVYNRSGNAVRISSVRLDGGAESNYTITVNGQQNHDVTDLLLRGKDSLLVLVSVTIDPQDQDLPFIVEDFIEFITNGNRQRVQLAAWGQDAFFVKDSLMACDTVWKGKRPIVLYKPVTVDSACTLTIDSGVSIYGYGSGGLQVYGSLKINGACDAPVHFRGTGDLANPRQYKTGQWAGIRFYESSKDNKLSHTHIINATTAIRMESKPDADTLPELELTNCELYNSAEYNLFVAEADAVLIGNAVALAGVRNSLFLACDNLTFYHNTFTSGSNLGGFPGTYISNKYGKSDDDKRYADTKVKSINNLFWSGKKAEIEINTDPGGGSLVFEKTGNVFVSQDSTLSLNNNAVYNITNKLLFVNGTREDKSGDPGFNSLIIKFKNPSNFNFDLDSGSVAIDRGATGQSFSEKDIRCRNRNVPPDAGAFEYNEE